MHDADIPRAEIIAIGDELTTGQRLDTNSRWLAAELTLLGVKVAFHTTAADTLDAGRDAFRTAVRRADLVVATGGLGPTADDLTREVLAAVAGVPLEESAEALAAVEARFARRGAVMPARNRLQALFPRGSRAIPNPDGTAPGIDLVVSPTADRHVRVFALPGVPAEMKAMWTATVEPAIRGLLPGAATIVQRRLKCFGAGESAIEAMLPDVVARGREPAVGITAHEATITLRIAARGRDEEACRAAIAGTESLIRGHLGDLVYGVEDDELEDAALRAVAAAGLTVASVEVATDGRVAALMAEAAGRPGAPQGVVRGGLVLPADAPDAPDARRLAERARHEFGATVGIGVGRPTPGPEGRQVVPLTVATPSGLHAAEHTLGGGAVLAGIRAAKSAVDLVRRSVTNSMAEPGR